MARPSKPIDEADLPHLTKLFWELTEQKDIGSCWEWRGGFKNGKPIVYCHHVAISAWRLSLTIHNRTLDPHAVVQPTCKNRSCVNPHHLANGIQERFESKIYKLSEEDGGCWIWTGALGRDDYGVFFTSHQAEDSQVFAHRYSFELHHDVKLPPTTLVCHTCDNPSCVNPAHLFLGDHKDNAQDRNSKGRHSYGEARPDAKLTESDAIEIKRLINDGWKNTDIAKKFGVTRQAIHHIRTGRNWSYIS